MPVTFRSVDAAVARALEWHLAPFLRSSPDHGAIAADLYMDNREGGDGSSSITLYIDGEMKFRHSEATQLLGGAVWAIHAAVPEYIRDFLCIHAGCVSRSGGGLLLPARRGSGKSTLTTALLMAGFGYLSDEVGAVDPVTGNLYPFEKLISLDQAALSFLPGVEERLCDRNGLSGGLSQRFVRPQDIGSEVSNPVPARWIVFPTADREGPPHLIPLGRAEGVSRLAEHVFNLHRYGERGVVLLTRLAQGAQIFVLEGGASMERAELMAEMLQR